MGSVKKSYENSTHPTTLILDGPKAIREEILGYLKAILDLPLVPGDVNSLKDIPKAEPIHEDLYTPEDLSKLQEDRKTNPPPHLKKELVVFDDPHVGQEYAEQSPVSKTVVIALDSKDPSGGRVLSLFAPLPKPFHPQGVSVPFIHISLSNSEIWDDTVFPEVFLQALKIEGYTSSTVPPKAEFIGSRIDFTPTLLRAFFKRASKVASKEKKDFNHEFLVSFLKEQEKTQPKKESSRLRTVKPKKNLDELILMEERQGLNSLISKLNYPSELPKFMLKLRPNGQRMISLFTGDPGTGKSASAEAIAKALGKDLWVLDLSQTQSKYVGESEKWLTEYFELAEQAGAVLLIDEAEVLISDRTSQENPHMRELTNHLLTLFDRYNGILILTTNFSTVIDPAFDRRIDYKVLFKKPSQENQIKILRSFLEPDADLIDIQWDTLLKGLDLTGGLLRNAVEKAFYRSTELKTGITHEILREALEAVAKEGGLITQTRRIGLVP